MKRNSGVCGTINSTTTQMDDNEDDDEIEIIQQQPIIKKSKSKNQKIKKKSGVITITSIPAYKILKDEEKEFVEFVLGDFHDFHKLSDLSVFAKMTSLTLLNESINDIDQIIKNIPNKEAMKFLCLNENQITSMKHIELLPNLEELHLNYNLIEKIPDDFDKYKEINFLNIAGNFIIDLKDIYNIQKLTKLKRLK